MTDATQLARACAEALYERDEATRRLGIRLLDAGPAALAAWLGEASPR